MKVVRFSMLFLGLLTAAVQAQIQVVKTQQLTKGSANSYSATWSPDGKWLAFISERDGPPELWVMEQDGGELRKLVSCEPLQQQLCNRPAWSPDGRLIAFASNRSDDMEIWLVEVETGQLRRVTDNPSLDWMPAWSPDGQWLACVSSFQERMGIWLFPMEKGDPRFISEQAWKPAWSSKGLLAFVWTGEKSGVYVVDPLQPKSHRLIAEKANRTLF